MSVSHGDTNRRIIPRWRFSQEYGGSKEFSGDPLRRNRSNPSSHYVDEHLSRWISSQSIPAALDAVAAGLTYGYLRAVESPARFLLENEHRILPNAKRMAELVAGEHSEGMSLPLNLGTQSNPETIARAVVRTKRRQLVKYPKNPIALLDMARAYTTLGHTDKAEKLLNRSLVLAPNHRIILRTQSRFSVHIDDPEKAHAILSRHPRTRTDPWLMASEIATAAVAERPSRFKKQAKALLASERLAPEHATELQSALATELLREGRDRQARQLFEKSLIQPTDNVVAQASWARNQLKSLNVRKQLNISNGFEARANHAVMDQQWDIAKEETIAWQMDEPFSSRPAIFGSYLGISIFADHDFALTCANIGLLADPNDPTLLNNKTVALAYMGELNEAQSTFSKISTNFTPEHPEYVHLATSGLLKFRSGSIQEGRKLYEEASNKASPRTRPQVWIHWAAEELEHNTTKAGELKKLIQEAVSQSPDPITKKIQQVLLGAE